MFFGYKHNPITKDPNNLNGNPQIVINKTPISLVRQVKYLGLIIDSKLTWKEHVENIILKVSRSLYMLNKLKFILNTKTLLSLYYALIYPYLNYCCMIWGNAAPYHINKLQSKQKRGTHNCQGSLLGPYPTSISDSKNSKSNPNNNEIYTAIYVQI